MRYLGILAGVILFVVVAVPPAPILAQSGTTHGEWVTVCDYSHSLADDPIVFPGQPGASHLHDFFGNRSTNANSTYLSLKAAGTNCETPGDTAAYWAPALYRNGVKIDPTSPGRYTVYYENDLTGYAPSAIQTIPKNFRVIAGNSHATSVAENPELGSEIYWSCSDNSTGKLTAPPNCSTGIVSLHIGFGYCWDGVKVAPESVVYPESSSAGYVCPSDHPVPIPRVIMRIEYPVGTSSSGITLSSGPTYTAHGDWLNSWHQRKLNALVTRCINTGTDCGENPTP